jgi:hypothetical protein
MEAAYVQLRPTNEIRDLYGFIIIHECLFYW